jgi:hypothetical protein
MPSDAAVPASNVAMPWRSRPGQTGSDPTVRARRQGRGRVWTMLQFDAIGVVTVCVALSLEGG